MAEPRASMGGVLPDADASPEMEHLSISELLFLLKSSIKEEIFDRVERILRSREESMREELTLKEIEKIELERNQGILRSRCTLLEDEIKNDGGSGVSTAVEKETASLKADYKRAKERIARLLEIQKQDKEVKEKYLELVTEYGDLECAKIRAENEVERWRRKYEELEARVVKGDYKTVIEISDSEDDMNAKAPSLSMEQAIKNYVTAKLSSRIMPLEIDRKNVDALEDDDSSPERNSLLIPTPKRKYVSRVVTSDSEDENDEEDRIPIGKLKMRKLGEAKEESKESNTNEEDVTPSRRRLVRLGECSQKKAGKSGTSPRDSVARNFSHSNTDSMISRRKSNACRKLGYPDSEEDSIDRAEKSECEGDSLSGFIVSESDGAESESSSNDVSEEKSDSDVDLNDVLAKIRREKNDKRWEYEADMLASFAKDPELCLEAVCALYRQQTAEEKSMKGTIVANRRGFSTFDAKRGSMVAEFLMDGDPHGPRKKSVKDLEGHFSLDFCRKLATHYSKQLFMIYHNGEDPFFCP